MRQNMVVRSYDSIVMIALILCATLFAATDAQSAGEGDDFKPPIAFAARLVGDADRSRLIVDFDREVTRDIYILDKPKRVIVDLPESVFSLDEEFRNFPKTLVKDLRYGTVAPGKSRIVLELLKSVIVENHRLKKVVGEERHRLIVDLIEAKDSEFLKSVRDVKEPVDTPVSSRKKTEITTKDGPGDSTANQKFVIVIDPGHGGVDGGASGKNRTIEKNVTLAFGQKLKTALSAFDEFNIVMTRDEDRFMGLIERVKIARESNADLLLSIHADSLSQRSIRGATVYTLSERGSDEISRSLARKQNRTDLIAGLKLPPAEPDVSDILIDMTRRETELFSTQFARLLVARMQKSIKLIRNPLRSANFYVLKSPEIPSILLELGYLSNLEDEKLMADDEWLSKAVELSVEAIRDFFSQRIAQK